MGIGIIFTVGPWDFRVWKMVSVNMGRQPLISYYKIAVALGFLCQMSLKKLSSVQTLRIGTMVGGWCVVDFLSFGHGKRKRFGFRLAIKQK